MLEYELEEAELLLKKNLNNAEVKMTQVRYIAVLFLDIYIYILLYKLKPFPQHFGGGHFIEVIIRPTHTFNKTFAQSQHFNQLGSNTAIHWQLCIIYMYIYLYM